MRLCILRALRFGFRSRPLVACGLVKAALDSPSDEVRELAINTFANFEVDEAYRFIRAASARRQMVNAPFVFMPANWLGFFADHGWVEKELRFALEISIRFKRRPPMPWWARLMIRMMSQQKRMQGMRAAGYQLLVPKPD